MAELFFAPLAVLATVIAVPTIGFMVIACVEGFPRLQLRQVAGIVAVCAWMMAPFAIGPFGEWPFMFLTAAIILLIFFATWRDEFGRLMLRREDEFPGRWDKLGWFLMLTIAAPAGVWLFRSFRKARWPESIKPKVSAGGSPWDRDDADEPSPAMAGVE